MSGWVGAWRWSLWGERAVREGKGSYEVMMK